MTEAVGEKNIIVEEDEALPTPVLILMAIIAGATLIGALWVLRRKYLKMMAAYEYQVAVSCGADVFVKETFDRHIVYKQIQQRSRFWRLNISFFPQCTSLGDTIYGQAYHLDLEFGLRDMVLMNEPLPVQRMCLVEFTLLEGSAGGFSGDVSFGITIKPPPVASFPGEYPHSYGLSSAGYSQKGDQGTVTRIDQGAYGSGDIISFAIDRIQGTLCAFKNGILKDTVTLPFVQVTDAHGWGAYICVATNGIKIDVAVNAGTEPFQGTVGPDLKSIFFENMALGWSVDEDLADKIRRRGRKSLILSLEDPGRDDDDMSVSSVSAREDVPESPRRAEISRSGLEKFRTAVKNMSAISRFRTSSAALEMLQRKVRRLEAKRDPKTITYPSKEVTQANISRCRRKGCECGCWMLDRESTLGLCKCGHARLYHRALPGNRDVDPDEGREISHEARLDVAMSHLDESKKPSKWRRALFDGHRFFYHCRTHEVTQEPHLVKIPSRAIRSLSHASCDTCDGLRKLDLDLFSPPNSVRETRKAQRRAQLERSQRMKTKVMSRRESLKKRLKESVMSGSLIRTHSSKLPSQGSPKPLSTRRFYESERVSALIQSRMGGEDTCLAGSIRSSVRGKLVSDVRSSRQSVSNSDLSLRSSMAGRPMPSSGRSRQPLAKSRGSEVKNSRSRSPASRTSSRSRSSHASSIPGKTTSSKDALLIRQSTDKLAVPQLGQPATPLIGQPTDNPADMILGSATTGHRAEQPPDNQADLELG